MGPAVEPRCASSPSSPSRVWSDASQTICEGARGALALRHHSAVRVLRHANCVWKRNPLDGVNEKRHVPLVYLFRRNTVQQHKKACHHEALYVMGVAGFDQLLHDLPDMPSEVQHVLDAIDR